MKNEPPLYPNIVSFDRDPNGEILPGGWGEVGSNDGRDRKNKRKEVEVVQVLDKKRVIVRDLHAYMIVGVDTSKLADGTLAEIPGIFYVDGTNTYKSLDGGTNTLRVVKPIQQKNPGKVNE